MYFRCSSYFHIYCICTLVVVLCSQCIHFQFLSFLIGLLRCIELKVPSFGGGGRLCGLDGTERDISAWANSHCGLVLYSRRMGFANLFIGPLPQRTVASRTYFQALIERKGQADRKQRNGFGGKEDLQRALRHHFTLEQRDTNCWHYVNLRNALQQIPRGGNLIKAMSPEAGQRNERTDADTLCSVRKPTLPC